MLWEHKVKLITGNPKDILDDVQDYLTRVEDDE